MSFSSIYSRFHIFFVHFEAPRKWRIGKPFRHSTSLSKPVGSGDFSFADIPRYCVIPWLSQMNYLGQRYAHKKYKKHIRVPGGGCQVTPPIRKAALVSGWNTFSRFGRGVALYPSPGHFFLSGDLFLHNWMTCKHKYGALKEFGFFLPVKRNRIWT